MASSAHPTPDGSRKASACGPADSELAGDGVLGPNVDLRLGVPRLAASELRALLGRDAPTSDWRGTLEAHGPRSAVLVSGDVQADAADDGGGADRRSRRGSTVRSMRARPIPIGDLVTEFEHVDLAGVAGGRLPASDLTRSPRARKRRRDAACAPCCARSRRATGRCDDVDVAPRDGPRRRRRSAVQDQRFEHGWRRAGHGLGRAPGPTIRRAWYGDRARPRGAHGSTRARGTRQRHLAARGRGVFSGRRPRPPRP